MPQSPHPAAHIIARLHNRQTGQQGYFEEQETNNIKKPLFRPKKYQTVRKPPDRENKISSSII
jgi:hypothetical protein